MAAFSGRVEAGIVSGGQGHSAVSKAAYNARCVLDNARLGTTDDYSRKRAECLFSGVFAPKDAPAWTRDREALWNHVETFEFGKRRDAQLARELLIALPHELSAEQNRYALQDFIRDNFTRKGIVADLAIHAPDRHGDGRNIHAHLLLALRKLDGTEFEAAKPRLPYRERVAQLDGWKRSLEHHISRHLVRHGFEPYYDLRSHEERGISDEPTHHMGKAASALERRGVQTVLGNLNRDIEQRNRHRAEQAQVIAGQACQLANDNDNTPATFIEASRDLALETRQETRGEAQGVSGSEVSQNLPKALQPPESEAGGLREYVRAGWEKLAGLVQRMEAAWSAMRQRHQAHDQDNAEPLRLQPPRRSIADELLAEARTAGQARQGQETPEQRRARERLKELLRRPDEDRDRGHGR